MLEEIEAMMAAADSLPELGEMLRAAFPDLSVQRLANRIADGLTAATAAGRFDVEQREANA